MSNEVSGARDGLGAGCIQIGEVLPFRVLADDLSVQHIEKEAWHSSLGHGPSLRRPRVRLGTPHLVNQTLPNCQAKQDRDQSVAGQWCKLGCFGVPGPMLRNGPDLVLIWEEVTTLAG